MPCAMKRRRATLSDQLRQAIDDSGMSRYAICKAAGMDQVNMSRFMARKVGLTLETAERIAELLDLELVQRPAKGRKGR